jgi:hypothetical protein
VEEVGRGTVLAMSVNEPSLDYRLAWGRVKRDLDDHSVLSHTLEEELIDLDVDGWLANVAPGLDAWGYTPSPAHICEMPKGEGVVRPVARLSIEDRVLYAALVGACIPAVESALAWENPHPDFSYRLRGNGLAVEWLFPAFLGWKNFASYTLGQIRAVAAYLVVTDISAYYEHVDLSILRSDLLAAGAETEVVDRLLRLLNAWAQVPGRGIPQGHSASNILGKLYLNSVDSSLRAAGYSHCRYVDDYRLFASDKVEAARALTELIRLLRVRGLSLNSGKTEIIRADDAEAELQGPIAIVRNVRSRLQRDIAQRLQLASPSMSTSALDGILEANPGQLTEIPRTTYQTYFMDQSSDFNKSLFHFVLNRLGKAQDAFAADHAVQLLDPHPEETSSILRYLAQVGVADGVIAWLSAYVTSVPASVYPYQQYEILDWLAQRDSAPSDEAMLMARRFALEGGTAHQYLRSVARRLIGKFGTSADLERLRATYHDLSDEIEQCDVLRNLYRMEASQRNAFAGRWSGASEFHRRAIQLLRTGTGPL